MEALFKCAEEEFLNKVLPRTSSRQVQRRAARNFITSLLLENKHERAVRAKRNTFYIWFTKTFARSRHLVDYDAIYRAIFPTLGGKAPVCLRRRVRKLRSVDAPRVRRRVPTPTSVPAQSSPDCKIKKTLVLESQKLHQQKKDLEQVLAQYKVETPAPASFRVPVWVLAQLSPNNPVVNEMIFENERLRQDIKTLEQLCPQVRQR
jgi:hypothetical protein